MDNTTSTPNDNIKRSLQTLNTQVENWINSKQPISLLEKDMLKETLRSLYLQIDELTINHSISIPSMETEIKKLEPEFEIQTSPKISISEEVIFNFRKTEIVEENTLDINKENIPASKAPIFSSAIQEMLQNATVINSVEQTISSKENITSEETILNKTQNLEEAPVVRRAIEDKTIEARMQEVKAATRFEEVRTIGNSYAPGESVSDKINKTHTGKSISEKLKSQPLADLKMSIGINERFAFINELFQGDQQLYHQSIERINSMIVYDQAKNIIHQELMEKLNWKADNQRFQEFDELIKRRFNS